MEQFQILTIDKVFESPLNPRHTYNEKKMEELIESIRTKGVLVPLLVRPDNGRFEIAAGHRRYRAAIKAELKEIPLIIREMNDVDFVEVLIIENDKHEDLEPLEQAQGYRTLMKEANYDIPAIALKISKSESYVYQRLKLLELIPEAQEQLTNNKITAGHAILIARLQPNEQKECLEAIKEEANYNPMSVRDLADFIERQIHLDLNSVSFSKKDPDLIPGTGPCTTCLKRTGFTPALFPDIKKKDTCTDPTCFRQKIEAYTARWLEKKSEDTDMPPLKLSGDGDYRKKKVPDDPEEPIPANLYMEITDKKKGTCEHAREGIITQGRNQGKVLIVCTDPKCKLHQARYDGYGYADDPKDLARRKAEEEQRKLHETVRTRILEAILKGVSTLDWEDQRFILASQFNALWDEYRKRIFKAHGWDVHKRQYGRREYRVEKILKSMEIEDLNRLSLEMALIPYIRFNDYQKPADKPLLDIAQRHGVDAKEIESQVKAEAKAKKEKKAPPAERKAKKIGPKLSKPESGVCRKCGCTHETPCVDPTYGSPCAWADKEKTICTVCAKKENPDWPTVQTSAKSNAAAKAKRFKAHMERRRATIRNNLSVPRRS